MSENLETRQRASHLGAALVKAGRRDQAAALLPEIAAGRREEAMAALNKALAAPSPSFIWMNFDPLLPELRSGLRFALLLTRMGF